MLGEKIDDEVNQFKKDLRASGGVVNTIVVVTAARGIAGAENRALLEKKKRWTHGCLPKNTFIIFNEKIQKKIQKDTKIVRKLLDKFEKKIKGDFLDKIFKCVKENNIPHKLIINCYQTGLQMVPTSIWTLEVKGSPTSKWTLEVKES